MRREEEAWMAYIDGEVRAVCNVKGWAHQVRRKWEVREKPVAASSIEDYQWKLITDKEGSLPADSDFEEGVYYLLWFERSEGKFIFQHDTHHCGDLWGPRERATYTEIVSPLTYGMIPPGPTESLLIQRDHAPEGVVMELPASGWLRDHLLWLVARYNPNVFSCT